MRRKLPVILMAFGLLSGCGTRVPDMAPSGYAQDDTITENDIIKHVQCEIATGAEKAIAMWADQNVPVDWLKTWQAKVNLKLVVDDTGNFNPGVSIIDPMRNVISTFPTGGNVTSAQNFTLGLGLQTSTQATRTETIAFTYLLGDLMAHVKENRGGKEAVGQYSGEDCVGYGRVPILGTLKIDDFIIAKAGLAAGGDPIPNNGKVSPFTVFSDEVQFIVTVSGNVNPVWKLVHVSANVGNSPLFNASRKRTQTVTITMGPSDSKEIQAIYSANLIAAAIRDQ